MIVLRNLSLIASIAILSLSAVLVSEAQTDIGATSEVEAEATSSPATGPGNQPDNVGRGNPNVAQPVNRGTSVSLRTRAQERVIKLAANMSNRFDATIARFSHISTRLESRIAKLNDEGIDTTIAVLELQNAKVTLDEARLSMLDIDAVVYNAVTSESPRTTWPAVRTNFREVHTKLLATHASLRQVVAALKDALQQDESPKGASAAVATDNEGGSGTTTTEEIMD